MKHFAKKTPCGHGHTHASAKEARRCSELHVLQQCGLIAGLEIEPQFHFVINGRQVKLSNGRRAGIKVDFSYVENGIKVAEDVKGAVERDFPLRWAIAEALWPTIDFRVIK